MDVLIYTRVSSVGQVIDGYGLAAQEDACRKWCAMHGHRVVDVLQEKGVSGAKDETERPALAEALLSLREGEVDLLLIPSLDRLARSVTVQEALLALIWTDDGQIASADQGIIEKDDPDDPWRTAMREMAGVMAGLERRLIVKRLRDGRRAKARAGGKAAGRYPYGWDKEGEIPAEQGVLALIRELRAEGRTWDEVASLLNDREIQPRTAASWSGRNVAKVS